MDFVGSIFSILKGFVWWFFQQILILAGSAIESVADNFFALFNGLFALAGFDPEPLIPYMNLANNWVPLDLAFFFITWELFSMMLIAIVRLIIKFIPKVGG